MPPADVDIPSFLAGGGEMGALLRTHDWAPSGLGPPAHWPQPLRTAIRLILNTGHPMYVWWGPDLLCFYNDAYRQSIGPEHHPSSLGYPARDVWAEIWPIIGPQIAQVMAGGGATWNENQLIPITRNGALQDVYWTYSYSPIDDDTAASGIGGVLVVCSETTARAQAERQLESERERQRLMLGQMPGFVALLSGPEHRYDYVNDAYRVIASDRDCLGRTVREVFPELAGQGFYELLDHVFTTGEVFVASAQPISLDRPDGERVIEFLYQPVRDDAGRVTGIFVGGYDITAAARAAEGLRASETRLRGVLDGMGEGFLLLDPDFRILEVNAETLRLENHTRADLVGRRHWDIWPDVENTALGRSLKRAMADRVPIDLGNRYAWPGARPGWFELRAYPAPDGLAVFYHDVTRREQAGAELREAEDRLLLAVDNAEIGFWDVDPVNDRLVWPARTKAMFGISPDVPVSLADFYAGLHPDDLGATSAAYAAAADPARRALYDVEYRTVGKEDGIIRWVAAKGRGIFDDAGRCIRVAGTAIDITPRKTAEAALAASEARYRTLFESIDAGFCVIEMIEDAFGRPVDYVFREVNPAFARQTSLADAVGRSIRALDPNVEQHWIDDYGAVARTGRPCRFESEPALGRWYDVYAYRIGEPAARRVAILFNDVTARRTAEDRLRELNETLEARVLQRTAELEAAHEQLRQAQKLDAMGSLTGGVAHDFNNLLTPIVGALDMLQRKGLGGEREQRLVAGAMQSADRAKTLVQRLLAFARRQPLQAVAVDLGALVRNMAELVASTTGPQIKVVVDVAPGLAPAKADPNQLEMALLNLSVNARDAMPDGGTLRISASAATLHANDRPGLPAAGSYLCLSVADTGTGMDETTLARAVEPFFSTKGIGKGTGLGLSMVHGLASQLGGALAIGSAPGLGTNVELWLPEAEATPQPRPAPPPQHPPRARGRVLLIDDEEFVRLSTADMLTDLGYDVIEAASAEAALHALQDGAEFDLVVTDHLMPGMTGTDLAATLRARLPHLPVVLVSGYAEVEGLDPSLPRLIKPFRKDDLAAIVATLPTP